ncbi:MAG: hypothetical protein JWP35_2273 [Caulobacter sp.]|nr:hypothetical protein [Caulobacter sp.]
MTEVPASDVETLRRRLIIMVSIVVVCAIVALASIIGELAFHVGWMMWTFGLALLGGFGAQAWMIVSFIRQGRGK